MKGMTLGICLCVAQLSAVAAQPAEPTESGRDARDEEARTLFDAAQIAMGDGRYEDARDYFRRAYGLSPRPGLLFNLAVVEERLRNDEAALDAYRGYLEAMPDADNRVEVTRRIAILEAALERARASEPVREPAPIERSTSRRPWVIALSVVGAALVIGAAVGLGVGLSRDREQAPLEGYGGVISTLRIGR
ncbi:MAG: hypothetical protein KF901_06330 [Myxococcales bacterium]|nr:hypothetical protein [Myxococcales bacterium]